MPKTRLSCLWMALVLVLPIPAAAQNTLASLPPDPTFGFTGQGNFFAFMVKDYFGTAIDPDGYVYVVGPTNFLTGNQRTYHAAIARFKPTGVIDSTFGASGYGHAALSAAEEFRGVGIQQNGKAVAGAVGVVARYNSDGTLDSSFGTSGGYTLTDRIPTAPNFFGFTILPDDRILMVPESFGLWWFSADGKLDSVQTETWNKGITPGAAENLYLNGAPTYLPNGKLLVLVRDNVGENSLSLTRLNPDGTRDYSFGAANGYTRMEGASITPAGPGRQPGIAVDGQGRIYVYGSKDGSLMVARFTSEGQFDTTFDGDGIALYDASAGADAAHSILLLPDGRILAGGKSVERANTANLLVVMFNPDGQLDTSFGTQGAATGSGTNATSWFGWMHLDSNGNLMATYRSGAGPENFRDGMPYIARYLTGFEVTGTSADNLELPASAQLAAPYPNPFNPATTVAYELDAPQHVRLIVYDLLGRQVEVLVDSRRSAGRHEITWESAGRTSGVYLVRLSAGGRVMTRAVTLLR